MLMNCEMIYSTKQHTEETGFDMIAGLKKKKKRKKRKEKNYFSFFIYLRGGVLHIYLVTFISFISYTKVHLFISCTKVQLIHFAIHLLLIYFTIIVYLIHIQYIWFCSYYIAFQPHCLFHFSTNPASEN